MLIAEEADRATSADERTKLFREFIVKSVPYISEHPEDANIWLLRAAAAIEVDYPGAGFIAG
jgi:hypothetical protein